MKITYYKETDSIYINLNEKVSKETVEVNQNLNIDFDENGNPVGIDIHGEASKLVDLKQFIYQPSVA
ncbi:MAG: DUF2283 domain-containing protein [Leptospiraceae bacterium]|nr:DUF2283 domain-containing protein [Leptospiraceae bacterium]